MMLPGQGERPAQDAPVLLGFNQLRSSGSKRQPMLEKAPITGAWDKRVWGHLVHYANLVGTDLDPFDKNGQ
jgi:hypothetical protein